MDDRELRRYFGNADRWQRVYRDEPILRTAAQMRDLLPEPYRKMRALAFQSGPRGMTSAEIFYKQARFMENHEDDFVYTGEFVRYYPTYQSMSDAQLRGYFSWRTRVRRGDILPTSLSFAYVYVYELLHCIGAENPEDAFHKLRHFAEVFGKMEPQICHYLRQWIQDFAVYYALDPALLEPSQATQFDREILVLRTFETRSDAELFHALCALSTYSPERSRYYKAYPERMYAVICAAFRELSVYYRDHRKYSLCDAWFGRLFTSPFTMFYAAIFYPTRPAQDRDYTVSPLTTFSCRGGQWTCTRVWGTRGKSSDLGALIRATDSLLRTQSEFPYPLKTEQIPKYLHQIILRAIDGVLAQENRKAAQEVHIDLSRLQSIRDAAEVTRDSLILEEETPFLPPEPPAEPPEAIGSPEIAADESEETPDLDETEKTVLRGVLRGEDMRPSLQRQGLLLSVVAETINEKCFDYLADTVLIFDGDVPQIPEEYTGRVEGWVQ